MIDDDDRVHGRVEQRAELEFLVRTRRARWDSAAAGVGVLAGHRAGEWSLGPCNPKGTGGGGLGIAVEGTKDSH
jgi:hypothetical protein